MAEPVRCPACDSCEVDKIHHEATFALPECWYFTCLECDKQWDHG